MEKRWPRHTRHPLPRANWREPSFSTVAYQSLLTVYTKNCKPSSGVGWPWGYRVTQLVRQGGPGGLITYLSNFKMTMLFWQSDSLALLAPTISPMNVGHFLGHSCFRIYTCITKRSHILGSCLRWRITPDTLPRYLQLWDRNLLKECVQNYSYYWSEEIFKSEVSQCPGL